MRLLHRTLGICGLLFCCAALIALDSRPAHACSGFLCSAEQFSPHGGTLPANAPAIAWWPGHVYNPDDGGGSHTSTASDLTFRCHAAGAAAHDIGFTANEEDRWTDLKPTAALPEGEECTLTAANDCSFGPDSLFFDGDPPPDAWPDPDYLSGRAAFRVGKAAPLPAAIGKLTASKATVESIELSEDAGCSSHVSVCAVRLKLELAAEAKPWRDALVYETFVDGKRWTIYRSAPIAVPADASYAGRGAEIVFVELSRLAAAKAAGEHERSVVMKVRVPGTTRVLETAAVKITLDCPVPENPDAGSVDRDASTQEARSVERDAGNTHADAAVSQQSDDDDGCAVAAPGKHARGASLAATLWLLATLAFVRRRSRARSA